MVDASFVSLSSNTDFDGDSELVVTLPSGYVADDILAVCIFQPDIGSFGFNLALAPDGWEEVREHYWSRNGDGSDQAGMILYTKTADGTEGTTATFTGLDEGTTFYYSAVAYRDAIPGVIAAGISFGAEVDSYATVRRQTVVGFFAPDSFEGYAPPAANLRSASILVDVPVVLDLASGPDYTDSFGLYFPDYPSPRAMWLGLSPLNSPPYAPTLTSMADGGYVPVSQTNRAYHTFGDPDEDLARPEGQSGFDIRYRPYGSAVWTTIAQPANTNLFYDFAPGTFTAGVQYEHQVRVYDLAYEASPWSLSGIFTGRVAPATPVITAPTAGFVISDIDQPLSWTSIGQTKYRVRKVKDTAGAPDPATVYYDSGVVSSGAVTSVPLTFPVNGRFEHLQVQIFDGYLWSAWASVRVEVDYVQPPAPVVTVSVDAETGSLVIEYDTPAPAGPQPTPTYVDIWIDDGGDIGDERKAAGLPLDGEWSYMTPRSGRDYDSQIRVLAYTADGISSE